MQRVKKLFEFFKTFVVAEKNIPHDTVLSAFVEYVLRGKTIPLVLNYTKFEEFAKGMAKLSPKDREALEFRMDELHDERKRRVDGQFYTPVEFVELAHALMDSRLGADWREKYVVWDASAGSLNLTRGHKFKELYSSTLQQEEVDRNPVNDSATESFFQFDFLNGNVSELPKGLQQALNANKPLLFFMNPPYSTGAKERMRFGSKTKRLTAVQVQSRRMGLSVAAKDLYVQFMIRIMLLVRQYKLTNVSYAVFSPLTFLTSESLSDFRKRWCDLFRFERGVMFDAGHFSGTSLNWAIQFSVWKQGKCDKTSGFKYFIVEKDEDEEITKTGVKYVHNVDSPCPEHKRLTPEWLSSPMQPLTKFIPGITTLFEVVNSVKEGFDATNRVSADHLGKLCYDPALTVYSAGNNYGRPGVNINTTNVGNLQMTPHNFEKVITFMVAARSLENIFIDQKDYFYTPDVHHSEWRQFVSDAVVFGLVCNGAAHMAMYDVEWYGRKYQLPNELFWLPQSVMQERAEKNNDKKALHSLHILPQERFVMTWLAQDRQLSPEAIAVLDFATDLTIDTFMHRAEFDAQRPEVQICNWDAGWWQLKELWKVTAPKRLKELTWLRAKLQKSLRNRLRLLGWLRPRDR